MKREILRVHELSVRYDHVIRIDRISLRLMGGESVGLLGLANSGKNLLTGVLSGGISCDAGSIYLEDERIDPGRCAHRHIYKITPSNYRIDNWTAAEYIGLVEMPFVLGIYKRKKLNEEVRKKLEELGISIDVTRELKELGELEKRIIDIAKACLTGARVIIIEDEFDGCSEADIRLFKEVMERIRSVEMVFIVNSNSAQVYSLLSDRYIIFRNGRIIKKIKASAEPGPFLQAQRTISEREVKEQSGEILFSVKNLFLLSGKSVQFDFIKGEVAAIICGDMKEKERIFEILSGRIMERQTSFYRNGRRKHYRKMNDLVADKIVSINHLGNLDELLPRMSIGENLVMPSLNKVTSWQYITAAGKMKQVLTKGIGLSAGDADKSIDVLESNEYVSMILERWYVFRPDVLLLFEPFLHCDVYGVSLVKSYIQKFTKIGTAVMIVNSREEHLEDTVTRKIYIDDKYPPTNSKDSSIVPF